ESRLEQAMQKTGIAHPYQKTPRGLPAAHHTAIQDYHRLLEAYRIQTYAQEIGSPLKVSPKRLSEAAEKLP
uniref:DUF3418 domain-containing protein n=1 Tax=Cardiobacterium valvarum TaxID=194702 RepID=UPI00058B5012